ncbi:MAG: SGNH/GDSL hydrolase family protein [Eubacterium sp.]|nr:SGNH/GDSL hydrolase family protein [Eubacterium sp.]
MKRKRLLTIIGILIVITAGWYAFCGYVWSWGLFAKLHDIKTARHPGNSRVYHLDKLAEKEASVLKEKKIAFLGSSVTYGASSQGISFVDYIGKQSGNEVIKEAVSGTTLVEEGKDSYIARLKKMNETHIDLFICQLSTNDATQKKTLGTISSTMELKDFDTHTVAGAMEYIIAYAKSQWNCPVMFYTNPQYDSEEYEAMVGLLKEIQKKWGIGVIDMWNDESFNQISGEERDLYMADPIHPTKAGYLEWWLPYMENEIEKYYASEQEKL